MYYHEFMVLKEPLASILVMENDPTFFMFYFFLEEGGMYKMKKGIRKWTVT